MCTWAGMGAGSRNKMSVSFFSLKKTIGYNLFKIILTVFIISNSVVEGGGGGVLMSFNVIFLFLYVSYLVKQVGSPFNLLTINDNY